MQRFFIIVTGWNCEGSVQSCYNSLINQTHNDWRAALISDGSTDLTRDALIYVLKDNRAYISWPKTNEGAAKRRHEAIVSGNTSKDDIILFLGMDDELLPGALERIAQEYDNGKLMTYGNWVDQNGQGLPVGFQLEFPDSVHAERSYRKVPYRSTAPNTFRRFLYDVIKPEDLQLNGEWFKATTESEVMFSCLEQCGKDRIGVIHEPIYLYNRVNGGGARSRFGEGYQNKIYQHVISKPKRELWES